MRMDEGMDTGPILAKAQCPIAPEETTASLTAKLAKLGAELLIQMLPGWLSGDVEARPQDHSLATYCSLLRKTDGHLDWARSAVDLDRRVRACDPWPGAYTTWQGQRLKVLRARLRSDRPGEEVPGTVIELQPGIGVVTGRGVLELLEVQLAGKKPMLAEVFALGQRGLVGGSLGP